MSREAVDKLASRIVDTARQGGREITGEAARSQAAQVARETERKNPRIKNDRGGER